MTNQEMQNQRRLRAWRLIPALIVLAGAVAATPLLRSDRSDREHDGGRPGAGHDMAAMAGTSGNSEMRGMAGMAGMQGNQADGAVVLTAADVKTFGVVFGVAERRVLEPTVRAAGAVDTDETRTAAVTLKYDGYIERLHAAFTGDVVQRGAPLLEIYSPALVAAQEELLLARRLEASGAAIPGITASSADLVSAARRRLSLWDVPDAVAEEVMRSGRVQRTVTVRSPVSGVLVEKAVFAGQAVRAGETLFRVADLSRVWVRGELREADAALARVGAPAEVRLGAYGERVFRGRVEYVQPVLREATRTIEARISLDNRDGSLRPGMYAAVQISGEPRETLTVPASSLVRTGDRTFVFVDMGSGRIMPHDVVTGEITAELAEVLSGIRPGERVVTSAQFLIDSESNLAEVMRSMIVQMGGSEMDSMPGMGSVKGADMRGMESMTAPRPGR